MLTVAPANLAELTIALSCAIEGRMKLPLCGIGVGFALKLPSAKFSPGPLSTAELSGSIIF